jgi:hypothetical protein
MVETLALQTLTSGHCKNKGAQKCGETNPETAKMQNEPGTSGGISEPELGPKICTPFIEIF